MHVAPHKALFFGLPLARARKKADTLVGSGARHAPRYPHGETKTMATSKKPAAGKKSASKPITEPLSKSGLISHLAEQSGVEPKGVRAVMAALEQTVANSVHKKGAGVFTLPGLLKITAVAVAAKPKRKGIDPFTKEERWFAAKPATVKVKVRALKKLKDAAI
jgi:nucleoid DNA-binding protein